MKAFTKKHRALKVIKSDTDQYLKVPKPDFLAWIQFFGVCWVIFVERTFCPFIWVPCCEADGHQRDKSEMCLGKILHLCTVTIYKRARVHKSSKHAQHVMELFQIRQRYFSTFRLNTLRQKKVYFHNKYIYKTKEMAHRRGKFFVANSSKSRNFFCLSESQKHFLLKFMESIKLTFGSLKFVAKFP